MQSAYELCLLGPLRLGHEGERIRGLRSRKAIAILAYVAAQEKPLPRTHLVDRFWPADSAERGYANLRWALNHLTSLLPGCLTISRHSVTWGKTLACDLHRFSHHLRQQTIADLAAAVDLYDGELMAGFVLDGCPDFELWLTTERERRLQQVVQALCTLCKQYSRQADYQTALQYAQHWLALTPWAEEAHRQVIYLLAVSGQRSAALHQYAACRQVLAAELGVEPAAETTALYEQIRTQGSPSLEQMTSRHETRDRLTLWHLVSPSPSLPVPSAPPHNLPRQLTPFVGRTAELAQIGELLANPTCAWLTLLGPGGIGKTRLALAAASRHLAQFTDGVYFVALASSTAVELLPATIAQALGLALMPGEVRLQLLNYLGNRHLLLVLDNFEHLLDGIELIEWLIQQAPGVKVLVTSRQRLHHQAEWVVEVGGLETPLPDVGGSATGEMAAYSAVQLFMQWAQRAHTGFTLTSANDAQIGQICRAVEGMPLGIQLAASWVRALPLATIVEEISHNLDLETPDPHGLPDRHRTLRAVIDSSWQRLAAPEQALLARLSIFRGSADWAAAAQVAGATPLLLTRLVDRSLLAMNTAGRIMLHELVRQFAAEQLQAMNLADETGAAHSRYYAALLAQQTGALISDQTQLILQQWDTELDNIRAAWQWAVQRCEATVICQMAEPLNLYYDYRTLLQEGRQRFQQAAETLQAAEPTPANEMARGMVLARYGLLLWRYGELALAEQVLQESRMLAKRHGVLAEEAYASYLLGYYYIGIRSAEAMAYLQRALALAEAHTEHKLTVKVLYALGWYYLNTEQIETGIATLQRSLQLARALGDLRSVAHVLCYLGNGYFAAKEYAQAQQCQQAGLSLFQTLGIQWGVAQAQYGLLHVAYAQGDYAESRQLCERTIPLYQRTGVHPTMLTSLQCIYAVVCAS